MKNAAFTICAKNFLPYAFALEETLKQHHPEIDFYIFLADLPEEIDLRENIILLDNKWIPNYQNMAFKYDIVEFNTSS